MRIREEGLLLRRIPFRDSSLVIHCLTRKHGRMVATALGVRGGKRSEKASLTGFHSLALFFSVRQGAEMGTLTGVEIATPRHRLHMDPAASAAAQLLQEAACRLLPLWEPNAPVLDDLEHGFDLLDEGFDPLLVTTMALGRMLIHLGYGWQMALCAGCARQENLIYFSIKRGQAVCELCGGPYSDRLFPVSAALLGQMRQMSWSLQESPLSRSELVTLYRIGCDLLAKQAGRPLETLEIFRLFVKMPQE